METNIFLALKCQCCAATLGSGEVRQGISSAELAKRVRKALFDALSRLVISNSCDQPILWHMYVLSKGTSSTSRSLPGHVLPGAQHFFPLALNELTEPFLVGHFARFSRQDARTLPSSRKANKFMCPTNTRGDTKRGLNTTPISKLTESKSFFSGLKEKIAFLFFQTFSKHFQHYSLSDINLWVEIVYSSRFRWFYLPQWIKRMQPSILVTNPAFIAFDRIYRGLLPAVLTIFYLLSNWFVLLLLSIGNF